jgi:Fuc2NAc and GlcNAc transferase
VMWFVPLWLINLYNFIDGIDGMAIIGAVFICAAAILILLLTGGDRALVVIFALLGASSLGFVLPNFPPARMFMGDAGSTFLGYSFAALLLMSVGMGDLSAWTWVAIFGYFAADTTTTGVCRVLLVGQDFWRGHRSHAYQNLARITESHAKVTLGVAAYQVLWALPMAIWSAMRPSWAPLPALLSVAPAVLWTLRYGPLHSRD